MAIPYHDKEDRLWIVGWGINNIVMPDTDRSWEQQNNVPLVYAVSYDALENGAEFGMLFMHGKTQPRKHPLVPAKGKLLLDQAHYPEKGPFSVEGDRMLMRFDENILPGTKEVSLDMLLGQDDGLDREPLFLISSGKE